MPLQIKIKCVAHYCIISIQVVPPILNNIPFINIYEIKRDINYIHICYYKVPVTYGQQYSLQPEFEVRHLHSNLSYELLWNNLRHLLSGVQYFSLRR